MRVPFGTRLSQAMGERGPLCAGIDAHPALLAQAGLPDTVEGLRRFTGTMAEAVAGQVAAVKPQSAFYERHGAAGVAVLETLLSDLASTGTLSILDVKRGDIGSTMAAYAEAYLADGAPLAADAVTLSPYLGFGSLSPALDLAQESGRGVFVLALTSNPEGAQVQHRGHPSVAAEVLSEVARRNATTKPDPQGPHASASVGVVVGANLGPTLERLGLSESLRRSGGPILAPGVGAQGATPADLASAFAGSERRVLAPVSRGLVASGLDVSTVRERCRLLNAELRESLYR